MQKAKSVMDNLAQVDSVWNQLNPKKLGMPMRKGFLFVCFYFCFNLVLESWRIPGMLLVFSLFWNSEEVGSKTRLGLLRHSGPFWWETVIVRLPIPFP